MPKALYDDVVDIKLTELSATSVETEVWGGGKVEETAVETQEQQPAIYCLVKQTCHFNEEQQHRQKEVPHSSSTASYGKCLPVATSLLHGGNVIKCNNMDIPVSAQLLYSLGL